MKHVNDEGPAFPSPTGNPSQDGGLTMRDWFAGQDTNVREGVGASEAAEIMGIEPPVSKESSKAWLEFWMAWEAYRKYAYADAMLKERGRQ